MKPEKVKAARLAGDSFNQETGATALLPWFWADSFDTRTFC